jgi:hypothetical protein
MPKGNAWESLSPCGQILALVEADPDYELDPDNYSDDEYQLDQDAGNDEWPLDDMEAYGESKKKKEKKDPEAKDAYLRQRAELKKAVSKGEPIEGKPAKDSDSDETKAARKKWDNRNKKKDESLSPCAQMLARCDEDESRPIHNYTVFHNLGSGELQKSNHTGYTSVLNKVRDTRAMHANQGDWVMVKRNHDNKVMRHEVFTGTHNTHDGWENANR